MKILCASASITEQSTWRDLLAAELPEAEVAAWHDDAPAMQADIAVVWKPPAALFKRERGLRAVFNLGAGVDALLALPGLPADLPIVRLEDAGMGPQMAEYVTHYLVRASRRFDEYEAQQKAGQWRPLPELDRRQWPVGVLGMGVLGAQVARMAASLGYSVAGWSRGGKSLDGIEMYAGMDALPAFLRRTRVLVNLLPLTPDTQGILNRATLSQLLPQGHLINIARGQHLVEEDLLPLIDEGHLSGATLDVFRQEPLPAEHPFWTHPRVTVTPHIAAISLQRETVKQVSGKIRALMRGEPITGVVARDRGY